MSWFSLVGGGKLTSPPHFRRAGFSDFKSRISAKFACAIIKSIPSRQFEFAQLLSGFHSPKISSATIRNFTYKILKKSPYKFHFPKKCPPVAGRSRKGAARSYCVDLVSRICSAQLLCRFGLPKSFGQLLRGGALIRNSTVSTRGVSFERAIQDLLCLH